MRTISRLQSLLALVIVAVLLLAGCGGSGVTTDELAAVQAERDRALERVAELEAAAAENQAELVQTAAMLESETSEKDRVQGYLDTATGELATVRSTAAATESALDEAMSELDAANTELVALRTTYDVEIRAAIQADIEAEVVRACAAASENFTPPVSTFVQFDESWGVMTSRNELIQQVEVCAAPERNKTAEEREADRLAECQSIAVDQLEKNPAAYEGVCVVMYARIVQFDTNTGPCSFHAELSASRSTRWSAYDVRSTFGYESTELASARKQDCPALAEIDGDDYIKVWALGVGSYSYSTSIGGTNTVPSFKIEKVELVQKD
jgi:hypothetical protein